MSDRAAQGLVDVASRSSVDETVDKLKMCLEKNGITLFALIDHSGEAANVGMTLRPTRLLIFGHPRAGTPLMQSVPSVAIDLPLKILVWEDENKKVWMTYNSPAFLAARHGLSAHFLKVLSAVETLTAQANT